MVACGPRTETSTLDGGSADLGFPGASRVAVILEHSDPDAGATSKLVVYSGAARTSVAIERARVVRWLADDELLEFLEADADPIPADPEFRARLREQLWGMVKNGVTALPKDH